MECKSIARTVVVWFVSCVALTVTAAGCRGEDETPPKEFEPPTPKPVAAKYATPAEAFDALHAARMAGQFDTVVACYSPVRLENEAETVLFQVNFVASRGGIPADKVKELDEFLKTHGFKGIADLKTPKDADAKVFVKGLLGQVKDRAAFVADHMKRQAVDRTSKGKAPYPAPTLKDVKVNGNRAEGTRVLDNGQSQTYFEFIDGSWRCSLQQK